MALGLSDVSDYFHRYINYVHWNLQAAGNECSYWYIGMFITDFWIKCQYFNIISDECLKNTFWNYSETVLQYSFVIGIAVSLYYSMNFWMYEKLTLI